MIHLLFKWMQYAYCTAQASTRPFIVSVKRQYLSRPQLLTVFPLWSALDTHSRLVAADASLFSYAWCRPCRRRTKHPSGSRLLTSRSHTRRPPLAPSVPQKTISSLPCPIVYCAQMSWLPCGSRFSLAHGRGVARLHNPVAGHLVREEVRTNQMGWLSTTFRTRLQPSSP